MLFFFSEIIYKFKLNNIGLVSMNICNEIEKKWYKNMVKNFKRY